MTEEWIRDGFRNFVLIGEAGSGKSELALNIARCLSDTEENRRIHFFDLDQTKPLYRSRDREAKFQQTGVEFHYMEQLLDLPAQVGGVRAAVVDPGVISILDVGGNENGARMIGGFSDLWKREDVKICYVINPFRPWNGSADEVLLTLEQIRRAARVSEVSMVCNPTLGVTTTAEEFSWGIRRTEELLKDIGKIEFCCVMDTMAVQAGGKCSYPLFPMEIELAGLWEQP